MKNFYLISGSAILGILLFYIFQGDLGGLNKESEVHPVHVEKSIIDLNEVSVEDEAVGVFHLINSTSENLEIAGTKSDCGCTVAKLDTDYLPGKTETEIRVKIRKSGPGYFEQTASVHFKDPNIPPILLIVRGEFIEKLP